jgi:hypothetical protein
LYEIGVFYGSGGLEMKIFTNTERNTIDATMINCHLCQLNNTFTKAHQCSDDTLNYVENRTKNINLFNIQLQSNLTDTLPMVQFYFSQPSVASTYKAPSTNNLLFEAHSALVQARLSEGLGRNINNNISQFLKDYVFVKAIFITGESDYITFRRATRSWLENSLTFINSTTFKPLNLTVTARV